MCACQGTEQTYRVALLQTLNTALQRALSPAINGDPVNYPEWIWRNGSHA
jgi:hypothetical protein